MKKIYLTLGLGALIFGAYAQQNVAEKLTAYSVINTVNTNAVAKTTSTSTLMPVSMGATGCASVGLSYYSVAQYTATPTYTIDARGYAFGTNATYQTQGATTYTITNSIVAQKYNVTGTGVTVTDILVLAGKALSDAGTSMVNAQVFSENTTTKAPNAQIGVTAAMPLNMLTTAGYNDFMFGTPVPVSGNFFAVIESPIVGGATNDTLAILSSVLGCSSTDSLSWLYRVINPAALQPAWRSVKKAYGQNLDLAIFPVIDISTGLNNSISKGDLTLLAAFPNPANNEISINFGLNQTSKVEIELYDVTGKIVNTIKLENLEAGNHTSKVNTSNLNAGVYMYSVKSENAKMFSKFTIAK